MTSRDLSVELVELNQMHQQVLDASVKLGCRVSYAELEGEVNFSASWFEEWSVEQRVTLLENWIAVMQFMLAGEKAMRGEENDTVDAQALLALLENKGGQTQ